MGYRDQTLQLVLLTPGIINPIMTIPSDVTTLVFDWGDTLMATDTRFEGAMVDWPEVQAVPGAQDTLAALHRRFHLVVATNAANSNTVQIRAALARVGLADFISEIFSFAEIGARKPDPLFFQRVALALHAAPHELVMVGDIYAVDIPGARRAGWRAVWYNPAGGAAPGPSPLHDLEIRSMADLPQALARMDLPDALTCQVWYLEQNGPANLWQHVEAVGLAAYHLAVWLRATGYPVDPLLAHRGGLLHDIAKISSQGTDLNHGQMGARLLNEHAQPILAEISLRHLLYSLLDPENRPRTWEEKIVHFADKICEGARIVEWEERLRGLCQRYPSHAKAMQACTPAVLALQAELAGAAGIPSAELVTRLRQANYH
jgi:HAD superfamily hydrolase (TIGR01509 family)